MKRFLLQVQKYNGKGNLVYRKAAEFDSMEIAVSAIGKGADRGFTYRVLDRETGEYHY